MCNDTPTDPKSILLGRETYRIKTDTKKHENVQNI